ncbi:MAG: glycerol kinase GlpK [Planctomycetota bacterium]
MTGILALDQGTTSSRAILFDAQGRIKAAARREFPQYFPRAGWVEHDPLEIWESQAAVMAEVGRAGEVAAIGIANQRETTVIWDRATGEPIHRALVWQDRRTAEVCDRLRADGCEEMVARKTGLRLDPYFSATKVAWILDRVEGARTRAKAGELAFGTVDSWLVWKLSEGRLHLTDASNASRTLLFNIHTGEWDDELLNLFGVPRVMLPEVRGSSEVYGEASVDGVRGVPIAGIAGDQQAALFGQAGWRPGDAKNTYGTGCFLLLHTGEQAVASKNRLLTTVAWRIGDRTEYALEGSVFIGGALVQWLRDGLGLIEQVSDIEALARSVEDSGDVYLVPAFAGLGAPHWDPYARGLLVGLTRGTTRGHVARAALDAIAFQVADVMDAMREDSGIDLAALRVDGGAAVNDLLLQIQADLLGVPVVRPAVNETTALGAAYLAGLAVGYWKDRDAIAANGSTERRFEPVLPADQAASRRARWRDAVRLAGNWAADRS